MVSLISMATFRFPLMLRWLESHKSLKEPLHKSPTATWSMLAEIILQIYQRTCTRIESSALTVLVGVSRIISVSKLTWWIWGIFPRTRVDSIPWKIHRLINILFYMETKLITFNNGTSGMYTPADGEYISYFVNRRTVVQ